MIGMTRGVTRAKISATVDRQLLARAKRLTGISGTSELLDRALAASVTAELESRWHEGYEHVPAGSDDDDLGTVSYGELGLE
jgi:post-segregation antitoxin (ccd killing protein)